jgi:hypothetical protein
MIVAGGVKLPEYAIYKLLNSLFLGASVGMIFTIYSPLEPSIYSAGGIILALAMLAIARLYGIIMNMRWFFAISLTVELVVLAGVIYYIFFPYGYTTALMIYAGYQITFAFGAYLVRAETLVLGDEESLTKVDSAKQVGYLAGMMFSWIFYRAVESFGVTDPQRQVWMLHFFLILNEVAVIYTLLRAFGKIGKVNGKVPPKSV